jgi:UDP-N-acetylmuramoyl-L-alanyl-D-glutamate--2,6-diaminopimelate ligase
MTLGGLLERAGVYVQWSATAADLEGRLGTTVTGIEYDSRHVRPGAVFVAVRGAQTDGVRYAAGAAAAGAAAVVAEAPAPAATDLPWIVVEDARAAMAALASTFYDHPSEELLVVGVTGTNGKTTTTHLMSGIFERAGIPCGRIGTVGYRIGSEERRALQTTPEAPDLQRLLREMVDSGAGACAMEVSSHALAMKRVDRIRFAAGVFTNLTRDHLDFHGDMQAYFAAKRLLFTMLPPDAMSIINLDDPRGASLVESVGRALTYGIDTPADVRPGPLSFSLDGLAFDVRTPRGLLHVRSSLIGRPNCYNILAAVSVGLAFDLPFRAIEQGVADCQDVPGRFQIVSGAGDEITVIVDYAHTDDALRNLLETVRPLAAGRLITVFGCGGDRDRTKRPLMGAVAARLSDVVIVTSDNPRNEDPAEIIEEIRRGIAVAGDRTPAGPQAARTPLVLSIVERRAAIERAIREAQSGDAVLVAGKGHERYQVIGDRVLPFDDVEVAREALARRRTNSQVS